MDLYVMFATYVFFVDFAVKKLECYAFSKDIY